MKTLLKLTGIVLIAMLVGCGGNDDDGTTTPPMETASLVGDWERTNGVFFGAQTDYLLIEGDNTFYVLDEDEFGFRTENTGNYAAEETQVTMDLGFGGSSLLNYTVTDTTLELRDSSGGVSVFTRISNAPLQNDWIQSLNIIEQGDAPWDETADIAFNGSHILLGNGYEADDIGLVNTETFALDGVITTTQFAFAVEVEKFSGPDKFIFQSSNGSSQFKAFTEDTNTEVFTSLEMGSWIYGLASVNSSQVWASSGNERTLYLLNYSDIGSQVIEQEYTFDRRIDGLDYQDGFLYACYQGRIFKCDVSTAFRVVDSYEIEGYRASGIAYDGTNFWINGSSDDGGPNQLIKTSLTL